MVVFFSGYGEFVWDSPDEYKYQTHAHGLFLLPKNYEDEINLSGKCEAKFLTEFNSKHEKAVDFGGAVAFVFKDAKEFTKKDIIAESRLAFKSKKVTNKPHGNTVNNEADRQSVLDAADDAMKNYTKLCQSNAGKFQAAKIARTIDSKSLLYWPKTGVPPIEIDTMTRLINRKIIDKKT